MKLGERVHNVHGDDSKFVVETIYDNAPVLRQAEILRQSGVEGFGESKLVGRVPMHLISEWIKEAGLTWEDTEAVQDLIRRKMLSGDFDKFRVWQGKY